MKFTKDWLFSHLDGAQIEDVIERLPQIGLEIEHITHHKDDFSLFTLAKITSIKPHPNADRLRIVKLTTRKGAYQGQVICGAPNLHIGQICVLALPDSVIPANGLKISLSKIRGEPSYGMLCSGAELNMNDDKDGILDLGDEVGLDKDLRDILGREDMVIDVEVTPNRPDWTSVRGIARDLAASGCGRLKKEKKPALKEKGKNPHKVKSDFSKQHSAVCPFFVTRYIEGVQNQPSPQWMQKRLRAIGLRPINILVDVSQYLCIDLARPLHIYDADKIEGDIHLRMAKKGERLEAIDGRIYELDEEVCVIADDKKPLGLGGVMGGNQSAVSEDTKNILVESAYFDPITISRTARKLNIQSDSSYRFERGIDPNSTLYGADLAVAMISDICGGTISPAVIYGQSPKTKRAIDFYPRQIRQVIGMDVEDKKIIAYLTDLGFEMETLSTPSTSSTPNSKDKKWRAKPPSWRPDIAITKESGVADLAEEVARLHGLSQMAEIPLECDAPIPPLPLSAIRLRQSRMILACQGLVEAVTWSFLPKKLATAFNKDAGELEIANPISKDMAVMRSSLLPGLLSAVKLNRAYGERGVGLFESGIVFYKARPFAQNQAIAAIRQGAFERHWQGRRQIDLWTIKADMMAVLDVYGITNHHLHWIQNDIPDFLHPAHSAKIALDLKKPIGTFGALHPDIARQMDIEPPCFLFELNLDALIPNALTQDASAPKNAEQKLKKDWASNRLQAIRRDFAFILDKDVPSSDLIQTARKAVQKENADIALFDYFADKKLLDDGKKSLTIELVLYPKQVMTDEQINAIARVIIKAVETQIGGFLRG